MPRDIVTNGSLAIRDNLNVDDNVVIGGNLSVVGTTLLSADPVNALEAATKQYVDGAVFDTSSNYTVTGAWTFDPTSGDIGFDLSSGSQFLNFNSGMFKLSAFNPAPGTAPDVLRLVYTGTNDTPSNADGFLSFEAPAVFSGTTSGSKIYVYNSEAATKLSKPGIELTSVTGDIHFNAAVLKEIADPVDVTDAVNLQTMTGYVSGFTQPLDGDLSAIAALSGTSGLLRKTAVDTWSLDTNSYLTDNQNITVTGDVTGSGTTSISTTLATVNSNVGSFGTASSVATFVVNAKGLITAAASASIDIAASQVSSGTFADARVSQSSVTQHQAALTVTESQITDGSLLARVGDNETITGTWTFSNPVTAGEPTTASHVTTKQYVDNALLGLTWKRPVRVATTANITLSGEQTIDGIAAVAGDTVLVKNQTATEDNGVYVASTGAWTRSTDFDNITPIDEINGAAVFVEFGTTQADTGWTQTANVVTVGTDPITFVQFSAAGTYVAGSGLAQSGNAFNIGTASASRIVVNPDDIDLAIVTDSGTGAFLKLTRDSYGRVTGTTAVVQSDISTLTDGRYLLLTGGTLSGNAGIARSTGAAFSIASADSSGAALTLSNSASSQPIKIEGSGNTLYLETGGVTRVQLSSSGFTITGCPLVVSPSTALTGSTQRGVTSDLVASASATTAVESFYARPATAIASFTTADVSGLRVANAQKGAGSTITNLRGVHVNDLTQGTNNFGVTSQVSSGSNKWNIYASGTAANHFAGKVAIGGTSTGSVLTLHNTTNDYTGGLRIIDSGGTNYWGITSVGGGLYMGNNGTDRVTVDSSGNVGLGIFPAYPLDLGSATSNKILRVGGVLAGNAGSGYPTVGYNAKQTGSAAWSYDLSDSASWMHYAAGQLIFYRAAAGVAGNAITPLESMRLDSSGRLGVGESTMSYRLHVGGQTVSSLNRIVFGKSEIASETNLPVIGQQSATSVGNDLALAATSTSGTVRIFTGPSTNNGEIGTGSNAERVHIAASGKVGVNIVPSVQLHVKSPSDAFRLETTTARTGGDLFMSFYDPTGRKGYFGYGGGTDEVYLVNELGGVTINGTAGNASGLRIDASNNVTVRSAYLSFNNNGYIRSDTANTLALQGGTSGTTIRNSSNSSSLVAVADSGKVTLSTGPILLPNNGALNWLDSGGTERNGIVWGASNQLSLYSGQDNTEKMQINSAGNVGVGTSAQTYRLGVAGRVEIMRVAGQGIVHNHDEPIIYATEVSGSFAFNGHLVLQPRGSAAGAVIIATGNGAAAMTERMRVDSAGNVGVGVAPNNSKLRVAGDITNTSSATTATTSATAITTVVHSYGASAIVWGVDGGNIFSDFVFFSDSAVNVLASHSVSGSPAARTYTASGGILSVAMASGTSSVSVGLRASI